MKTPLEELLKLILSGIEKDEELKNDPKKKEEMQLKARAAVVAKDKKAISTMVLQYLI